MKQFYAFLALLILLVPLNGQGAQDAEPTCGCTPASASVMKRAKANYDKAYSAYINREGDEQVHKFLDIAENIEPCYADLYLLRATLYEEQKNFDSAIAAYKKAFAVNPDCFPNGYFFAAQAETKTGRYQEAEDDFTKFLTYKTISDKMREEGEMARMRNRETLKIYKNAVPFNPKNLGPAINSPYDEYLPQVSIDDSALIFTRRYLKSEPEEHLEEDFFIAYLDTLGQWQSAVLLPGQVNSSENEGSESLTADGNCLFFAAGNREDGMGSFDIYVAYKTPSGEWGRPKNIGSPVNTGLWESQPCISADGRTLYFVSNRPGGFGGSDIWKSELKNGVWSRPENLGPAVNTAENEYSPFLHMDGKTLYFASNGHGGLGGLDLFVSRLDERGRWGVPQNLGYPINTHNDEATLTVNAKGNIAYYTSNRLGGYGGNDIYWFELYEQARPETVSFMRGLVVDAETEKPLPAKFELINLKTGEIRLESSADEQTGSFLVCLPCDEIYALNVSCPGYLFYSEHVALDAENLTKPKAATIRMQPVKKSATIVLNNIFYQTDKFALEEISMPELRKVFWFLRNNPDIQVEISGHTDNTGSKDYNKTLSLKRAQAVADFLINSGIESDRIKAVGYGSDRPVADNDTEEGRALNRRTEMKIL